MAMKQLMEQKRVLSNHTEEIQKINNGLVLEKNALEKDRDVIAAFARKLGFVFSGEKIVKISGVTLSNQYAFDVGTPKKCDKIDGIIEECYCKIIGILSGIVFFLAAFFKKSTDERNLRILQEEEQKMTEQPYKKKFVKEIPVYDLSQV